jgi:hypothetical protein
VPQSESVVQLHPPVVENPAVWHAASLAAFPCEQRQQAAVGVAVQASTDWQE